MNPKGKKISKITYDTYSLKGGEWVRYITEGILLDAAISYLFYRSYVAFLIFLPIVFLYVKRKREALNQRRREHVLQQFKDGIQALLAALEAGYSLENAFLEACKDLKQLYDPEIEIIEEFQLIIKGIRMNQNVEELLQDFSLRSGMEDIQSFAEIFTIAKRKGGNLLLIIRSTVQIICEKAEVQQEIQLLMAGKKLEQKIMNVVPFGILFYVNMTSGGFLDCLYGNMFGALVMTVCLAGYFGAILLSDRIIQVEV